MQQQLPALTFCWQEKHPVTSQGLLAEMLLCRSKLGPIPPALHHLTKSPKHLKCSTTAHSFQTQRLQLPSSYAPAWFLQRVLFALQWLYQLVKVWMPASCFLMVKSRFWHSLSWDACAYLDLKILTLQNCIRANCLFQNVTGIDTLTLL